ncbi:MAG TPA: phasin family protein [Gaiellaceae bacterium]|nr:phasin family protein [Gaiellaceae bacterium]
MPRTTKKYNGRTTPMLRDSVEQIWLAGLGALALTEDESSRFFDEGSKFFKTLVKRGEGFERATRTRIGKAVASAREVPSNAISRIEETFDDTMTGVLHRIGVPTQREIESLARRVEGLATSLERRPSRRLTPPKRKPARATRRRTTTSATKTATSST